MGKNGKVAFKYEDTRNPEQKEQVYFIQGKRVRVRPDTEVEVDPIIAEIENERKALRKKVEKSNEELVVIKE